MKKFSIRIWSDLGIYYNHYLSTEFIEEKISDYYFEKNYPLTYSSRWVDKPSIKWIDGAYTWCLDDKYHRIGKPAWVYFDGRVLYYKNGEKVL